LTGTNRSSGNRSHQSPAVWQCIQSV